MRTSTLALAVVLLATALCYHTVTADLEADSCEPKVVQFPANIKNIVVQPDREQFFVVENIKIVSNEDVLLLNLTGIQLDTYADTCLYVHTQHCPTLNDNLFAACRNGLEPYKSDTIRLGKIDLAGGNRLFLMLDHTNGTVSNTVDVSVTISHDGALCDWASVDACNADPQCQYCHSYPFDPAHCATRGQC
jgi:hypothetical protein